MAVKAPKYWENLVAAMSRRLKERGFLTEGDVSDLTREVRGRTGGQMRGQKAQAAQAELADSDSDPYEDIMSEVRSALRAQYGTGISVLATFADHIVYGAYPIRAYDDYVDSSGDTTKYYSQKYTENESTEKIEFGERQEISKDTSWKPVDGSGDDDDDDDDLLEGSFEDNIRDIEEELRDTFGDRCYVVNTWPDHVVYCVYGDGSKYYSQKYTFTGDDVELDGDRTQVERNDTWSLIKADDGPLAEVMLAYKKAGASGSSKGGKAKLPKNVQQLPEKAQRQWVDIWNSAYERCQSGKAKNTGSGGCEAYAFRQANGVIKRENVAADDEEDIAGLLEFVALSNGTTTEKPWDGSASRYKDTAAYCKACLIDDNKGGSEKVQEKCHLPVYEPNGTLNLNAVRNAASRIDQVKGVSAAAKAAAARKLSALKNKHSIGDEGDSKMGDTTLDGQLSLAGAAGYSISPKHGSMTTTHSHMHADAGVDDGDDDGLHQHTHTHKNDADHSGHSHTDVKMLGEIFSADVRLANAASAADTTQKQTSKSPAETGSTAYGGAGASSSVFSRMAQGLPNESLKTTWLQVYSHERMLCHGRAGVNCDESARDKADAHMKSLPVGGGSKTDSGILGDDAMGFTVAELRLADANGGQVPVWQQLHKVGEWTVPHGSGLRIKLTQDMGDTMIRNFRENSLRRSVPLDEAHNTDNGGPALGWLEDMRWGKQGEGLDNSEPGGNGSILYGRFRYNPEGNTSLANERFKYISPQYALDYQDKESGNRYGCTLTAVAATNNPFLRLRSIQGEAAPEVAVLSDGLIRPNNGGTTMGDTQLMDQLEARLSERLAQREREIEQRFEAKLTEERRKREESDVELAEERRARHLEVCHNFIDGHIRRGLPPAFAKLAEAALVNSSPKHEGTIKLDEGTDKQREINLHALVREMVELASHLPVDETRTVDHDNRPPNDPSATLDDQVITSYKNELLSSAGVRLSNTSRNGRNGRVALAEKPADLNGQDDE